MHCGARTVSKLWQRFKKTDTGSGLKVRSQGDDDVVGTQQNLTEVGVERNRHIEEHEVGQTGRLLRR